ncbi:MAG: beta-mannanase-like protein [Alphaproteobacteria bacterium]|nr:beta-mannanase-like protein [Alphaproteobacteria bacterium]
MGMRNGNTRFAAAAAALTLAAILAMPAAGTAAEGRADRSQDGKHGGHQKPKQRGAYWGAWIGSQLTGGQPPWDMSAVSAFESLAGKGLSLLEFASPFASCEASPCTFYDFPRYEMERIRNYGAVPFFSWGSQSTPVPLDLNEPAFQLGDIARGAYDSYIREFAEGARDWGHPFFLRFDWEMNGNWFPWAEWANANRAGEYIAAWRHVHDIFTSVGATNATWVWCPYANPRHRFGPLARYYPGNGYVDWTCLDGFNWAKNGVNPQPWRSFSEIFGPSYRTIVREVAPRKPMLLGEMASGGSGRAKATWIDQMFKQLRTKYRRIRGLIWFDLVDRGVQWPIETSPRVTSAFARGLHQPAFRANSFSATGGTPIVPPG